MTDTSKKYTSFRRTRARLPVYFKRLVFRIDALFSVSHMGLLIPYGTSAANWLLIVVYFLLTFHLIFQQVANFRKQS